MIDLMITGGRVVTPSGVEELDVAIEGERIAGTAVHGTGCALASAITAQLARGEVLDAAVETGRRFVAKALRNAESRGTRARLLSYS